MGPQTDRWPSLGPAEKRAGDPMGYQTAILYSSYLQCSDGSAHEEKTFMDAT